MQNSEWKEQYRLGVEPLDTQHKQLVKTTEALLRAAKTDCPEAKEECKRAVEFCKNYTVVHFQAEEMYQQRIAFADAERHKALHQELIETLRELEFELIRTDYDLKVVQRMGRMMTRWWMFHIMQEDKKMVDEAYIDAAAAAAVVAKQKRKADEG